MENDQEYHKKSKKKIHKNTNENSFKKIPSKLPLSYGMNCYCSRKHMMHILIFNFLSKCR